MRVISVLNQKGGVAKTTTAAALAFALAEKGYRTLVVDTDAQGNLSESFCFTTDERLLGEGMVEIQESIYNVLLGKAGIKDAIYQTKYENLHICPSDPYMADIELQLSNKIAREAILQKALRKVKDDYDFVVIDTPPALGSATINVMVASDYIIIPAEAERYSVRGIEKLADTLNTVKESYNDIKILGILLVRYENIKNDKTIAEYSNIMAEAFGTIVFDTKIRQQKFVKESRMDLMNIIEFARINRRAGKEDAGSDYEKFADEVLEEIKKVEGK